MVLRLKKPLRALYMVQVIKNEIKGQNKAQLSLKKLIDSSKLINSIQPIVKPKKVYKFHKRVKNELFDSGVKRLSFEACLITTNGSKNEHKNGKNEIHIKTQPKWYTYLNAHELDTNTGELLPTNEIYVSDDFKCSNGKKIKSLDRFCKYYQPLYQDRVVTLWFLTFTQANKAKISFNTMSKIVIQYYKRLGINVRAHIWTAEIGTEKYDITKNPADLHWHYHMCVATDRVNLKGAKFPELLKFDNIWGQYTDIDFVKKNIRHYMSKYFAKCSYRVIGSRSYGCSRKLI